MDLNLTGKTALVTGGSKGIGLAIAELFAEEGVNLHLAARDAKGLDEAAAAIRKRYNVSIATHTVDLSSAEGIDRLGQDCKDVDILVNNAGSIPSGPFLEVDRDAWHRAYDLKLFGFIYGQILLLCFFKYFFIHTSLILDCFLLPYNLE